MGRDKIVVFIRECFFWFGMFRDVDEWIKGCKNCILRKLFINIRVFLISIEILEVLELVCLDYFFLEMLKGGY